MPHHATDAEAELLARICANPVRFDIGKGAGAPLEALRERFGEALLVTS